MKRYPVVLIMIFCLFGYSYSNINISHSGYTNLYAINRIDDGSVIKLPFRLLNYDLNINYIDFNIKAKWGLEHKIKSFNAGQPFSDLVSDLISTNNVGYTSDFREFYFSYFPSFGELKIGKQIHAWGATDISSPIDVLNSIDYYYLFTDTDETKIGRKSLQIDFYLNQFKLGFLFMPNHIINNIPDNDPDFPITLPATPQSYQMIDQPDLSDAFEFGAYFQASTDNADWIFSYFSGYDHNFNLYGSNVWQNTLGADNLQVIDTIFSYRQTDMYGFSNVSFIGDITLRSDFAFFMTDDGDYNIDERSYQGKNSVMDTAYYFAEQDTYYNYREINGFPEAPEYIQYFNFHGSYYQYAVQLEYSLPYEIDLITQIFGYNDKQIKSNEIDIDITNIQFSSSDLFFPGMGSSMATLAENGALINFKKSIWDDSMEFEFSNLFDTKDKGQLMQFKLTYNVIDNLNLSLLYYKGKGNHSEYVDNPDTVEDESLIYPFNAMEKFSHIRAQLQYFF